MRNKFTQQTLTEGIYETPFKEGLIGRTERFMIERYQFHPLWARSLGTILVTAPLGNLARFTFSDRFGDCYANPFFIYIGRSGLAIKTPPLRMIKAIIRGYNQTVMCPTSFNPDSFPEYVAGVEEKTNKDGKVKRKAVVPHPINLCIADEASKLLGEMKAHTYQENLKTFLSELWDGQIEGKYTRGFQTEGNSNVFFSMLAATSKDFYRLLNRQFFTQGLGNRILWVVEDKFNPPIIDAEKFFFNESKDEEFQILENFVIDTMRVIDTCLGVMMTRGGARKWADFTNKFFDKISHMDDDSEAEYCSKMPLNAIKLSICYCASRLHFDEHRMLFIGEEDMDLALNDVLEYFKNWRKAMQQWQECGGEKDNEERIRTSKYDMITFVRYALANHGTICVSEVLKMGSYTDRNKISSVMQTAELTGLVEVCNRPDNQDELTNEEYQRYKITGRGRIPVVWRVTEKGKEKCA